MIFPNKTLCAGLALALVVPATPVLAQGGELSQCRPMGQEFNYPCALPIADGVVRSKREHGIKLRADGRARRLTFDKHGRRESRSLQGAAQEQGLLERLLNR